MPCHQPRHRRHPIRITSMAGRGFKVHSHRTLRRNTLPIPRIRRCRRRTRLSNHGTKAPGLRPISHHSQEAGLLPIPRIRRRTRLSNRGTKELAQHSISHRSREVAHPPIPIPLLRSNLRSTGNRVRASHLHNSHRSMDNPDRELLLRSNRSTGNRLMGSRYNAAAVFRGRWSP